MRFLDAPLWPQPGIPWPLQVGAIALWSGLAALVLYGLALVLPHPWNEVGWLSFPPAAVAVPLGLLAVVIAQGRRQKGLGLAALVAVGFFVLALTRT